MGIKGGRKLQENHVFRTHGAEAYIDLHQLTCIKLGQKNSSMEDVKGVPSPIQSQRAIGDWQLLGKR